MVITLTPLTRNQLKSVVKVTGWVVGAYALTLLAARLKNYHFSSSIVQLGIPGYINIGVVFLSKIFQQEESQAIAGLPAPLQAPVGEIAAQTAQ